MDLSIVIVSYNSEIYLSKCIASIYQNTKALAFEVIIVDNASTDNSIGQVKKNFPQVNIIANQENHGFSAANNQGIEQSQGRHVLLLNHDTEIRGNALKTLVDFMDQHPEAGACGAKVLNSDGSIQHQCKRGFPTPLSILFYATGLSRLFPKSRLFGHYLMTYLDPNKINEIDALSGACMLVRREVVERIGLLDESFFLYGEDIDYSYRVKEAGWKVYYVPQAEIVHYGGVGSRIMSSKNIMEFHRSMLIFYKKHYVKKYPFPVTWLVYAGIYLKCGVNLLLNSLRKDKYVGSKKP